ncbi:MAG TPA: DUF2807 domain-containing protein [Caulobacterales bacterium]|nr:DUF2807 domain-containing protein [Caulobacterales bacterium]
MERFVFNIAVVCAVAFALVMGLGFGHIKWEFADAFGSDPVVRAPAQQVAARTYAAAGVHIEHAAARVVVIPEARQDISIEINNPGGVPTPAVSFEEGADKIEIDGQLRGRVRDCREDGVVLSGYGQLAADQLPLITIHAPMAVDISVDSGSTTQIGRAQSVEAAFGGCGAATIADVAGPLKLSVGGSGRITAGGARELDLELGGSGEVRTGAIASGASVSMGGSGEVSLASLTGDLRGQLGGSGTFTVQSGAIGRADIDMSGSGQTRLSARVQQLSVDIAGSGGVSVDHGPTAEADLDVGGSGHVRLMGPVDTLRVSLAGSGDVSVDGVVRELDAEIAGSGTIRATEVTGNLRKEVFGSGRVIVDR